MKSVRPESIDGRLRFSPEQVSQVESVLDAEYMPFYFQDIRTNEIIAFHAFLEDLSDSYSAEYNSTSGYGRVEDIKSYKSTKRSVGCTFHVVATNPQDFEYMWWQINKLTTMVYPQWSKGRDLNGTVNEANFKFTQPFSQIPTATPIVRLRVGDLIRSNYSRFNLKRLFGYQDSEKAQSRATSVIKYTVPPGEYPTKDEQLPTKVSKTIELGTTEPPTGGSQIFYEVFDPTSSKTLLVATERLIKSDPFSSAENENVDIFYNPENNTIVKSFESTRGYGLAAVVTQLQFTWMDGLWGAGEDGPGNRAPRTCKVQMSFDPIHDIAPGLDHEGFNRAPIYPVGGLVNRIVEGGEPEPYGAGTSDRYGEQIRVAASKAAYEEVNKQTPKFKIF
jgi:hypothetical protein